MGRRDSAAPTVFRPLRAREMNDGCEPRRATRRATSPARGREISELASAWPRGGGVGSGAACVQGRAVDHGSIRRGRNRSGSVPPKVGQLLSSPSELRTLQAGVGVIPRHSVGPTKMSRPAGDYPYGTSSSRPASSAVVDVSRCSSRLGQLVAWCRLVVDRGGAASKARSHDLVDGADGDRDGRGVQPRRRRLVERIVEPVG